jgi:magnesium transporter
VYSGDFMRIAAFRLPWLFVSLIGSLMTSLLVPLFVGIPGDAILFASLVPVVMAMTGNVGSQTAMIVTRGLAIGVVDASTMGRAFVRESTVGVLMGVASGIFVGLFTWLVNNNASVGIVICGSMLLSMTAAALVGAAAPIVFKRMNIDPAIAAGPLVTTSCDFLGVAIYLLSAIVGLS